VDDEDDDEGKADSENEIEDAADLEFVDANETLKSNANEMSSRHRNGESHQIQQHVDKISARIKNRMNRRQQG
jgi:hypothetical protein